MILVYLWRLPRTSFISFPLEAHHAPLTLTHHVACLRVVHPRWPCSAQFLTRSAHPFLFMGLKTSSHDRTRCRLVKFLHDLLSPCNLCLLVLLENRPPVHFFLVDELSRLQTCLELCWFTQALLQPWLQDGKCRKSNYGTLPNGWCITQGTQPKGKMSCLKSWCYN
jgi:hypothetical protein